MPAGLSPESTLKMALSVGAFGSPALDALEQDTVLMSRLYIFESPYMMVGDSYLAYLFPLEVFPFSGCSPPLPDNILL